MTASPIKDLQSFLKAKIRLPCVFVYLVTIFPCAYKQSLYSCLTVDSDASRSRLPSYYLIIRYTDAYRCGVYSQTMMGSASFLLSICWGCSKKSMIAKVKARVPSPLIAEILNTGPVQLSSSIIAWQ